MSPPSSAPTPLQHFGSDKKRLFLVVIISAVIIVSWTGVIDYLAVDFLNNSLMNAMATYGSARLINGGISVLQSTTVEIGIAVNGSINLGQFLDPINDAVERLSNVMAIAIGSLVLQKTLLAITSSIVFKTFLTLAGIALIISSYIKEAPYIEVLSKIFVFLAFMRLSLGFMLLLNLAVDQSYLAEKADVNKKNIESIVSDVGEMNAASAEEIELKSDLNKEIIELEDNKSSRITIRTSLFNENNVLAEQLESKMVELDQAKSELDLLDQYNPLYSDKTIDDLKSSISELERSVEIRLDAIEKIEEELEEIEGAIIENNEEIVDITSGMFSKVKRVMSKTSEIISNLTDYLKISTIHLLDAMILFAMKTLIFPILFMYLLTKGFKLIWGIDARELIKREYKTLKMP